VQTAITEVNDGRRCGSSCPDAKYQAPLLECVCKRKVAQFCSSSEAEGVLMRLSKTDLAAPWNFAISLTSGQNQRK
jgi:hypothetical protein